MVSNASDDLPEPDRPVETMRGSRGRSRERLRALWPRAPRITPISDTRRESTGARMPKGGTDVRFLAGLRVCLSDTVGRGRWVPVIAQSHDALPLRSAMAVPEELSRILPVLFLVVLT